MGYLGLHQSPLLHSAPNTMEIPLWHTAMFLLSEANKSLSSSVSWDVTGLRTVNMLARIVSLAGSHAEIALMTCRKSNSEHGAREVYLRGPSPEPFLAAWCTATGNAATALMAADGDAPDGMLWPVHSARLALASCSRRLSASSLLLASSAFSCPAASSLACRGMNMSKEPAIPSAGL